MKNEMAARESQVSESFSMLFSKLDVLENEAEGLNIKIASVLRTEPQCGAENKEIHEIKVDVATRIDEATTRVDCVIDSLRGMNNTCEL